MAGFSRGGGGSKILAFGGAAWARASSSDEPAVAVAHSPSERLDTSSAAAANAGIFRSFGTDTVPIAGRSLGIVGHYSGQPGWIRLLFRSQVEISDRFPTCNHDHQRALIELTAPKALGFRMIHRVSVSLEKIQSNEKNTPYRCS
jgi:hypothetical protein